jgi:hypothetical protein
MTAGGDERPEPDRGGRNAMSLKLLAATIVLLILVGCAPGQGPPAPYPHDNNADIRSM